MDIVTGASAGAMTAALVARAVMVDIRDRRFLKKAWVDRINITDLLSGIPDNSLLSEQPIRRIANEYLSAPDHATPSSIAPARLLMRFAVTNMSGVDYTLQRVAPPGPGRADFVSTFFAERREFELTSDNVLDAAAWDAI